LCKLHLIVIIIVHARVACVFPHGISVCRKKCYV